MNMSFIIKNHIKDMHTFDANLKSLKNKNCKFNDEKYIGESFEEKRIAHERQYQVQKCCEIKNYSNIICSVLTLFHLFMHRAA